MPRSRGQQCSWKEMEQIRKDVLPAIERGDGKYFAQYRCVGANTVSTWKATAEVVAVLEDKKLHVRAFSHFQPTHAREITRGFRRLKEKPWSEETKDRIVEVVQHCEKARLTQKQIREHAAEVVKEMQRIREGTPKGLKVPQVKPGEWWQLGDHLLYCGDTASLDFTNKIPNDAAFAFADPPYNAKAASWDEGFVWDHDWLAASASIVAVTPGIVSIKEFMRRTEMAYQWSMACWVTNGMTRGAIGFGNWIYIALFGTESVFRQSQDFVSVTINNAETKDTKHKGRKPAALLRSLIETFTNKEDVILDPFLGSGTTLLVAEDRKRKCIGGEISPGFCRDIIRRWQDITGREAKRYGTDTV